MTTLQKSFAFGALALAIIVGAAGVFGPSAYSVAHAQAKESVNRAFARLANLSDEERANLAETHGLRMAIRGEADGAKLAEILAEAKEASDLQIISADEIPMHGFVGRAGRALGFKMVHKLGDHEERLALLPEEVRKNFTKETTADGKTIYRHNLEGLADGEMRAYTSGTNGQAMHVKFDERNMPVTFMVFTNAEGYKVYLGLNADDEPVSVRATNGELPAEGQRVMIKSENGDVPEDGHYKVFLKSEGDTLPGGEGKVLYDEQGNVIR